MRIITPRPLTRDAFRPFGEVIEMEGHEHYYSINDGFTDRYNDLCRVDVASEGGSTNVSIFLSQPRPEPIAIRRLERHPLGTQAFIPLADRPWLVLVAEDVRDLSSYRAFHATGLQGVNYGRNVWHHPLLALDPDSRFLIVDRKGPGNNLEEVWLEEELALAR